MEYDELKLEMYIKLEHKKTGKIRKGKIIYIYGDDIIKILNNKKESFIYTNEYIIKEYIPKNISKNEILRMELKKLINNDFIIT